MSRILRYMVLSLLGVGLSASAVMADNGTESPFMFGAGARELSLGGGAMARSSASSAAFWNPSGLSTADRIYVSGFHSTLYESDVAYQFFSVTVPTLDYGTFSLGVFRLGVSGIERRDDGNLLLGEFSDNRLRFHLAYAARFSGYDLGASAVLESHSIDDYSATSSPGLNLAASRTFGLSKAVLRDLTLAITLHNVLSPSTKLDEESVKEPLAMDIGAALGIAPVSSGDHRLLLTASGYKSEFDDLRLRAGIEYSFGDLLYLRGGLNDGDPAFGAGLSFKQVTFDYALVDRELGSLHMFTLSTGLGPSLSDRRESRRQKQESEFNNLMQDRLTATNKRTVDQLVKTGSRLLDDNDLLGAYQSFDRALLLARGAGLDTTEIATRANDVRARLDEQERLSRFQANLNAAQGRLVDGDFLAARHFAEMALQDSSGSMEAQNVIRRADEAVAESSARERLIEARLLEVDSLLSYGYLEQALTAVQSLERFSESNANVRLAVKRVEFERWREKAAGAYARGKFEAAIEAVDSALVQFPGHQWCVEFRREVSSAMNASAAPKPVAEPRKPQRLSPELEKEAEAATRAGQKAFEQGKLADAITHWERVERIAPNYGTVREYLLHAYKYVGVELYGQNKLEEAVAVWKKANALDPSNEEIQEYIRRTENEIRKLKELSYDQE